MAFAEINQTKIFYEVLGNPDAEETIVFLNGVMTTTTSWGLYYPMFAECNYRILLHDFRGQMKSHKSKGPYTFEEHAKDLKELVDLLNITSLHLIGTSYGAAVGMRFAIDYPEYVRSLSIIDGSSEVDETTRLFLEGWKGLAAQKNGEAFFWGAVPTLYHNTFVQKNKTFLEERAKLLNHLEGDYYEGQVYLYDTFIHHLALTDELSRINCPSLIVWGEEDILTPRKFSERLVEKIPQTEFVIIPECGHVTIFEQPETLKSILLGFVLKHSKTITG